MSSLDCTIIILSFNSKEVTDTCLAKVEKAIYHANKHIGNRTKVIVVDNASSDGSAEMIRYKYPFVELMALKKNIGYAAGNNLAMKTVKTPYILLMNSDIYIEEESLTKTYAYQRDHEDYDILVSRYVSVDKSIQKAGGYLPTPFKIIAWACGVESLPVLKKFWPKIYGHNPEFYTQTGTTEWFSPCFWLMKTEVFTRTHGFDEKLFFHMVDAEWCHRIHAQGMIIHFTPSVEVVHLGGASSKGLELKLIKDNFQGLLYFCRKHYPHSLASISWVLKVGLTLRSFLFKLIGKKELAATYSEIAASL